jgi:hypothetical protein
MGERIALMKTFIFFCLGVLLGAYVVHVHDQREDAGIAAAGSAVSTRAGESADAVRDSVSDKLAQWHLTSGDIKADLDRTGQVIRSKAVVAGDEISDARIATVIKAKYVLDRDISAMDISVAVDGGHVVLTGRVGSPEIIGRAMALALDTDGVANVVSRLTVRPPG